MRDYRPTYKQDTPTMWAMVLGAIGALITTYVWVVIFFSL